MASGCALNQRPPLKTETQAGLPLICQGAARYFHHIIFRFCQPTCPLAFPLTKSALIAEEAADAIPQGAGMKENAAHNVSI